MLSTWTGAGSAARTRMSNARFENVVVVRRQTELDELVRRFNTEAQAKFYIEQAGHSFDRIQHAHTVQQNVMTRVMRSIPQSVKQQVIWRESVPQFTFGQDDLVVTVGQDGLVSNTAKYLDGQPILAINPDPELFDGVLLPFNIASVENAMQSVLKGDFQVDPVTLALARSSDNQELLAFNDFFIGANSHVSARYEIEHGERRETHSSSGIIVSTGAGSTGWLQSVYAGAAGIANVLGGNVQRPAESLRLPWDTDRLVYAVREPFPSQVTGISMVHGAVSNEWPLKLTSRMARNGIIFSDGVEADYLEFNSGTELTISTAPKKALLISNPSRTRH